MGISKATDAALAEYLGLIAQPEHDWDLFEIALRLGCIREPEARFEESRRQMAELAAAVHDWTPAEADDYAKLNALNAVLYERMNFQGDAEDYYSPDNSFVHRVLERRKGIPVTLCLLYRQLASGIGVGLNLVGMPGHFLLGYEKLHRRFFIDAFRAGVILLEEDCRERFGELFGHRMPFNVQCLSVVSEKQTLLRMLANLKQIYRQMGDSLRLFRVLQRRIPLLEDPLAEILERGVVQVSLEMYKGALRDFEHFVENTSDERMKALISEHLAKLRIMAAGN